MTGAGERPLWNPRLGVNTGHTGKKVFFPVFQGFDRKKPNQSFFPISPQEFFFSG
jgi:hypothetical protein